MISFGYDKTDVTPIGFKQYSYDFQSKVAVHPKNSKRDNKGETATRPLHRHVKTHERNIKASRGGDDKTLKRRRGGEIAPYGEDGYTYYGNGDNTHNREIDTYSLPIENHNYSVRAPSAAGPALLLLKETRRLLKETS